MDVKNSTDERAGLACEDMQPHWVDGGLGRRMGRQGWSRPGDRRGRFAAVGGCWRFAEGGATSAGETIRSGSERASSPRGGCMEWAVNGEAGGPVGWVWEGI